MQKKALAVAIAGAMVPVAAQAVSYKISGHVNRALQFIDDGKGSQVRNVDNSNSRSRFRFVGSEKFGSMQAGIYVELGMASNRTTTTPGKNSGNDGDAPAASAGDSFDGKNDDIRHSALWFSGSWGKLTMGHTADTFEGIGGSDLSGTFLATNIYDGTTTTGEIFMRTTAGAVGTDMSAAFNSLDGGRIDLIRYDSPALGPFKVGIYSANDEEWGATAFVNTSLAGGKLTGKLGYQDEDNRSGHSSIGGSASFLFSQGTAVTFGFSNRDFIAAGRDDGTILYFKLGHKWGNNAVAIDYFNGEDTSGNGAEADAYGIGFVHKIPKPGVELYVSYKHYELDEPGVSNEDVDIGLMGARVKF